MAKKSQKPQKERLFEEKLVPAKSGSGELFDVSFGDEDAKPVECLGMTFPNDAVRRAHFTEILREKLKDPEFRKIEGFPIGDDEDILALSDPPYYTACPNPFLADFLGHYGTQFNSDKDEYHREPFSVDVSEGKYDPLYRIHAYPTKVPYRAIMRYILHYTSPGDVIFDGFAGTGMTGVAAMMCSLRSEVSPIAATDGTAKEGPRYALLTDLSPNATHIASNYVRPIDKDVLEKHLAAFFAAVDADVEWMYKTTVPRSNASSQIEYTVWSEIYICGTCSKEYSYWDASVQYNPGDALGIVASEQECPHCKSKATRRNTDNAMEIVHDPVLGRSVSVKKHVPVLINYSSSAGRGEKIPDTKDRELLDEISRKGASFAARTALLMHKEADWGDLQRDYHLGITHSHHFFTLRNLQVVSSCFKHLNDIPHPYRDAIRFIITSTFNRITNLVRYMPQYKERNVGPLSGTLYKPALFGELNVLRVLKSKAGRAVEGLSLLPRQRCVAISTQSSSAVNVADNSIDYIFTDPPFGDNLPYSELNFSEETWLGVHTNQSAEAIISDTRQIGVSGYQQMMKACFVSNHRILKPGRWMTVVFHNSKNAVWNAIQEAMSEAGFVVADVRILDKKRGTTKQQVYTSGAVKQDLVISAYKPTAELEQVASVLAGSEKGAWEFVRAHLAQLPVFIASKGKGEVIAERQNFLLFDRMVAFHVQRGLPVPLSASEFYSGLRQKMPERDGMYFLPDQVQEYEKQRMVVGEVEQMTLFVSDEKSAIQWVRLQLMQKQMTFQEMSPLYMQEALKVWEKHERPIELLTILEQNYVVEGNGKWRIPDPKKEADLEQIRHRALMREFQQYLDSKGKLKVVRIEALRAGFKDAWQKKDYTTIVQMAKRVPDAVIQEDQALLMYFDNASLMLGE